jgi:dTDP-6-deoxy-L-talose 4-dehydrogenase (NAD+)
MKNILVTGASGFIGNYLITKLLKADFRVIATSSNYITVENKPWKEQVEYIPFNFKDYSGILITIPFLVNLIY